MGTRRVRRAGSRKELTPGQVWLILLGLCLGFWVAAIVSCRAAFGH